MSSVTESAVLESLRAIIDPDFGKDIVELGFVKELAIEAGHVSFAIELTTPACPVKEEFERGARECVMALEGVEEVSVTMTAQTRGSRGAATEAEVETTESALAALDPQLADPEVYRDGDRVRAIEAERSRLQSELDRLYRDWERLGADVEAADEPEGEGDDARDA